MADTWRFGPVSEADFEPLLALRVAVMRAHLERVDRFTPERSRAVFRRHFDEPGLRPEPKTEETTNQPNDSNTTSRTFLCVSVV